MNSLNHVAIIMDGNGRWGLKNKNSRNEGHRAGLNVIENILKETISQKIKFIIRWRAQSRTYGQIIKIWRKCSSIR